MKNMTSINLGVNRPRLSQHAIALAVIAAVMSTPCHAQQSPSVDGGNPEQAAPAIFPPNLRGAMPRMPCEKPIWPKEALQKELEGTVAMKFLIDADGRVFDKAIVKSSGHAILDVAALEATARCTIEVSPPVGQQKKEWVLIQYVWVFD